eukprot:433982_1
MAKHRSNVRAQKCPHRGIFELTAEIAFDILSKQNWRCYYSDIPLEFEPGTAWNFSIERLNNNVGYSMDNTRFICNIFNTFANSARPRYNIKGSPQWSRDKMNHFLQHKFDFTINYDTKFE